MMFVTVFAYALATIGEQPHPPKPAPRLGIPRGEVPRDISRDGPTKPAPVSTTNEKK